jgi:hypothetical protein
MLINTGFLFTNPVELSVNDGVLGTWEGVMGRKGEREKG